MAISSGIDCGDVFNKFSSEGKFADASKNFIESRRNYYKLTKHSVEYGFAIAEVTSIVPTHFIPIFQAIRSIVTIVFEGWSIFYHIQKVRQSKNELSLCNRKIEKWNVPHSHHGDVPLERRDLGALRDRYLLKIQTIEEKSEKEKFDRFRKERWEEYIQLITAALDQDDDNALETLQQKFSNRKQRKVTNWQSKHDQLEKCVKKSYISIAIAVGSIALEIINLVGIAFIPVDAGLTFTAVRISSGLLVSAMKYGKYLWWNIKKGEKPGILGIKSFEYIGTAIAKTKLLPYSNIIHHSMFKGASNTAISSIRVFQSRYNYMDNNQAIGECRRNIEQLRRKKITVSTSAQKIAAGNRQEMHRVLQRYEQRYHGAEIAVEQFNLRIEQLNAPENKKDRDDLNATIGIMRADMKKWAQKMDVLRQALHSNDLSDAKIAADALTEPTFRQISNWSLSEQLHKKNNLKEGMKTALSIVEIARFAFLITAVTLALVGIGVNLLPFLFISSVFANLLYMGYSWFNLKTNKEIDQMIDIWSRDEIVATTI